ncbi:unnamed protein product [Victoria cruziana]
MKPRSSLHNYINPLI